LTGPEHQILSHPPFHPRLARAGPHVALDLPRDRGGPCRGQQVAGDRPGDGDLPRGGDQVALHPAVDAHRPCRGVQVASNRLPGGHRHLLAAADLAAQFGLLGRGSDRQGRQRQAQDRDPSHRGFLHGSERTRPICPDCARGVWDDPSNIRHVAYRDPVTGDAGGPPSADPRPARCSASPAALTCPVGGVAQEVQPAGRADPGPGGPRVEPQRVGLLGW
jgi:hypothetical protein